MLVQFNFSMVIVQCKSNPMTEIVNFTSTYECTLYDELLVCHGVVNILWDISVNHSKILQPVHDIRMRCNCDGALKRLLVLWFHNLNTVADAGIITALKGTNYCEYCIVAREW